MTLSFWEANQTIPDTSGKKLRESEGREGIKRRGEIMVRQTRSRLLVRSQIGREWEKPEGMERVYDQSLRLPAQGYSEKGRERKL